MKFKQVLASQRVKGWEDYYLDYKLLCKCIKADKARRDARRTNPSDSLEDDAASEAARPLLGGGPEANEELVERDFNAEFIKQLEGLNLKISEKVEEVEDRWHEIREIARKHPSVRREGVGASPLSREGSGRSLLDPELGNLRKMQKEEIDTTLRSLYEGCMNLKQICDLNLQVPEPETLKP